MRKNSFYNRVGCITNMAFKYYIIPLSLNSKCIPFTEIFSLLTLCLAPLITHVASGSASVSYLVKSRPHWYERICHYNPTSILWRYAAITDRRIRATSWDNTDMALSNAIFWTSHGWNGSEEMVAIAEPYCCRLPAHSRVEILSSEMLKTIITTAQGISASYGIMDNLASVDDTDNFLSLLGVDSIFLPLALFGLLRLCAAAWLTEDYAYALRTDNPLKPIAPMPTKIMRKAQRNKHRLLPASTKKANRYRPLSYWPSVAFRIAYVIVLVVYWLTCSLYVLRPTLITTLGGPVSLTMFLTALLYFAFLTISIPLLVFFLSRKQIPTIIPCISSSWYRAYTHIMFIYIISLTVIATMETNKAPQGGYTTMSWDANRIGCNRKIWFMGFPSSAFFGLASTNSKVSDSPGSAVMWTPSLISNFSGSEILLYNFTGYCVGIAS
jgi:hypothetical protein